MRFRVGPVPDDPGFCPEVGGWTRLKEPSLGWLMVLSIPLAVGIAASLLFTWSLIGQMHGATGEVSFAITTGGALAALLALLAMVVAHEFLHVLSLPQFGLGPATTLGFWPQAFTPYVSYEGELSRGRQIVVGVAPFLILSVVPLLAGLIFGVAPPLVVVLGALNGFGSSADLIGAAMVAFRVPACGRIRSRGDETWWRSWDECLRERGTHAR
ncbi:MAG: DUF3267 domain-containing protein [Coriobacteriia bacterium]|nr:DUF3267 domain-containing protein [Coriobacteriia bacterium]